MLVSDGNGMSSDKLSGNAGALSKRVEGAEPETGFASNGEREPSQIKDCANAAPMSLAEDKNATPFDAFLPTDRSATFPNGEEDDVASEAETLVSSPVKRREAEKQQSSAGKSKQAHRMRIGGLPVPGDDDDDADSAASPLPRAVTSVGGSAPWCGNGDIEMHDQKSPRGDVSEPHASVDAELDGRSKLQHGISERTGTEQGDFGRQASRSLISRKRKHRTSSSSFPNTKRQSVDTKPQSPGGLSEDNAMVEDEPAASPNLRSHRRAASAQSGLDGTLGGSDSKRRRVSQLAVKEPKSARPWDESDESSEATFRGPDESKRLQRGLGRSTSTPGRPPGREHKRHINKYGFTRLAEACEDDDLDEVMKWRDKDPDQLELSEFAGNKPLQIAALNGNTNVVRYLIDQGCQIDCANVDKDTPLIDAAENGHVEVVRLLLDAGVDPLRPNLKGQQALDVVTDDADDGPEIRSLLHRAIDAWNSTEARQRREEEEEQRHRAGPSKELHFMARTYENLIKLVQNNDRNGVREFLAARVPVDNDVIGAAAKTGDLYLLNMLLAEMTEKKARQQPERPMLNVLGSSHFDMVKALTELDQFNPLWRSQHGKTWAQLAEERNGPMWRQEKELLNRLYQQGLSSEPAQRRCHSPTSKHEKGQLRQHRQHKEAAPNNGQSAPVKKNGRRLLSRKDLRAQSTRSESSEGELVGSDGREHDVNDRQAMKPPQSPSLRRAAGRPRSKSSASQPPDMSPRPERSSTVDRGHREQQLPTPIDHAELDVRHKSAEVKGREAENRTTERIDLKLRAKGKDDEAAEVKPKRSTDDVRRNVEERRRARQGAERLKAELSAEQERKTEGEREAGERRKETERREGRNKERADEPEDLHAAHRQSALELEAELNSTHQSKAEEQRKAEEHRRATERREVEARHKYRADVLAALHPAARHVLDESSDFTYEGLSEKATLVRDFCPLKVVRTTSANDMAIYWILNIQAAPLIGKRGVELLFKDDPPGSSPTSPLAATWTTAPPTEREVVVLDRVLESMPLPKQGPDSILSLSDKDDFENELKATAERLNAIESSSRALKDGKTAVLRLVRLDELQRNLHPLLRASELEPEHAYRPVPQLDVKENGCLGVVDRLQRMFEAAQDGDNALRFDKSTKPVRMTSKVQVVHEQ